MATKSVKKQKKRERTFKSIKTWADKVFSVYIRQRGMDEFGFNTCFTCGTRKPWKELQCGHYISRSYYSLRYNEINCNPQCVACNVFKKGNLETYTIRLMDKYGDNILRKLDKIRWEKVPMTRQGLFEIIQKYGDVDK